MLRKNTWLVLVMFAVLLPSTLLAQEMMHGKWWQDKAVAEKMKLTDGERNLLDEKYTASRRKMINLKSEVEKERLELDIILDKQDADKGQINEQYERLEKARGKLSKERFELLTEVREVVGTERFKTLKSMHRSKRNKMGRHSKDRSSYKDRN
jgi:Spy/CpxP family protein refolding chaperone